MVRLNTAHIKLAAIDLDGTLLGPDARMSSENARAVQRLQGAGVHVLLASGRHYINMRRFAEELTGVEWLVSCQGGETSDTPRQQIVHREFLDSAQTQRIQDLGDALGLTTLAYLVEGVFTDADGSELLEFYTRLSGNPPQAMAANEIISRPNFKILRLGEAAHIDRAMERPEVKTAPVTVVRTHKRFLEFMPPTVSKGAALGILAKRIGMSASETIAFGDGDNDVPMFEWAGMSVAMDHGWPGAKAKAKIIAPAGAPETAFARAVDRLF